MHRSTYAEVNQRQLCIARRKHSSLPAVGWLIRTSAFPAGIIFNTYKVAGVLNAG